jgi:hypothetical protein
MTTEQLIALMASVLMAGRHDLTQDEALQSASALIQAAQRYADFSRETALLKEEFKAAVTHG